MKYILLVLGMIFLQGRSQVMKHYEPLRCEGKPPQIFTSKSSERYKKDREGLMNKRDKLQNKFSLNTEFGIEELLMSGQILYGDSISIYLSALADQIFESDLKLRLQLKFLTMNDAIVNAFSTPRGCIFITTGLLAHIKTEGELAFIMCHEAAHYIKKHSYNKFRVASNFTPTEQNYLAYLKYSQGLELEADAYGLELFIKAGYRPEHAYSALHMLEKSAHGLHPVHFDFSQFEDSQFRPGKDSSLSFTRIIPLNETLPDSLSTHPDMDTRIVALESNPFKVPYNNRDYLLDSNYLKRIVRLAAYEYAYMLISEKKALDALFITAYLDSMYGMDQFTQNIKLQAFELLGDGNSKTTFIPGPHYSAMIDRINTMKMSDRHMIACRLSFMLNNEFTRIKRIECLQKLEYMKPEALRYFYAWDSMAFDMTKDIIVDTAEMAYETPFIYSEPAYKRPNGKGIKKWDAPCYALDSIMFYNPNFDSYTISSKVRKNHLSDEDDELKISRLFRRFSKKLGIHSYYLFMNEKQSLTTEMFNYNMMIRNWLLETSQPGTGISAFNQPYMNRLIKASGCSNLALTGFFIPIRKEKVEAAELALLIYPPFFVIYMADKLNIKKDLNYAYIVMNLRNGNMEMKEEFSFDDGYKKDIVKAHIYKLLLSTSCE